MLYKSPGLCGAEMAMSSNLLAALAYVIASPMILAGMVLALWLAATTAVSVLLRSDRGAKAPLICAVRALAGFRPRNAQDPWSGSR